MNENILSPNWTTGSRTPANEYWAVRLQPRRRRLGHSQAELQRITGFLEPLQEGEQEFIDRAGEYWGRVAIRRLRCYQEQAAKQTLIWKEQQLRAISAYTNDAQWQLAFEKEFAQIDATYTNEDERQYHKHQAWKKRKSEVDNIQEDLDTLYTVRHYWQRDDNENQRMLAKILERDFNEETDEINERMKAATIRL